MQTTIETIKGIPYRVTRRDDGTILSKAVAQDVAVPESQERRDMGQLLTNLRDKVMRDGQTLTPLERDRALVACLLLLRRISF